MKMDNRQIDTTESRRIGLVSSKTFFRYVLIFLFAIVVSFLISNDNTRPEYYMWLPLLPIGHVIIVGICMFFNKYLLEKWQTILAIGLYSIRNLLTPLIMYFGNYTGSFKQLNNENVVYAIILMLYETMFVLVFLSLYGSEEISFADFKPNTIKKASGSFDLVLVCLVVFCFIAYLLLPSIRSAYINLFSSEGLRVSLQKNTDINGSVGQRGIFTLFQVVFPITYTFLAVKLLCVVRNHLYNNRILKVILSLFISIIPAFFMDGGDGNTIIFIVAIFLTSLFIDKSSRGNMVRIAIIGGSAIVIYIFIQAMSSTFIYKRITIGENLSNMFQSYFPGVCNMAGLFNMNTYNKLSQFFYDLYSTIPFRKTLFGLSGFDTTLNLYTYDNNAASHIMPCVAHAYFYFGFFAPIIPCIILKKSHDVYKKMQMSNDPFRYVTYTLIFLYLVLTPVMYNSLIFLRHFLATFVPMLILCRLNGKGDYYEK